MAPARINSIVLDLVNNNKSTRGYDMAETMTMMMQTEMVLMRLQTTTTGVRSRSVIKRSRSALVIRWVHGPE